MRQYALPTSIRYPPSRLPSLGLPPKASPYTKTGGNGVYERRHELPEAFHAIGKHRLAEWVGTLLDREELVMAMVDGSKLVKWLDVPNGPMGSGGAAFVTGHLKRAHTGQRDQTRAFPARPSVPSFPLPDRERKTGWERQAHG